MPNILFNTGATTFSELIGNEKIYSVPPYQRDYSWDEEEWEDLWLDILGLKEEHIHYNRDCGTKLYDEKKDIYGTSSYKLTGEKSIYTTWTPETLRKQPESLADIASTVWKVSY